MKTLVGNPEVQLMNRFIIAGVQLLFPRHKDFSPQGEP
jgi:hypothetical protein